MKLTPKAEASLNKAVERFRSGSLSTVVEITALKREPPVPFDEWSWRNRLMAYAQSDSTDLRTIHAWNEVGRKVKKGSTASAYILEPKKRPVDGGDGEKVWIVYDYRATPRYKVEDTEGEPLPESFSVTRELPELADVARKLGIPIKYVPNIPGALGDTDGKRIHLNTGDESVFFHEFAHAVQKYLDGGERKGTKAERETIAEFTACVLMELYGYGDRSGNAWSYIKMFHSDPIQAINEAMGTVQRILCFLFNEEDGDGRREETEKAG